MRRAWRLLPALAVLAPLGAAALEPRFDHRDLNALQLSVGYGRESTAVSGKATLTTDRPVLQAAYGFDVSGEGDELLFGGGVRLAGWDDPERGKVLLSVDSRYRGYFGTDELKTYFELGLWVTLMSRVSAGPLVGLGLAWDFSREFGLFVGGQFATAIGENRVGAFQACAGAQYRWE